MAALGTTMSSTDADNDLIVGAPTSTVGTKPARRSVGWAEGAVGGGDGGGGGHGGGGDDACATEKSATVANDAAVEGKAPGYYWFDLNDPSWPTFLEKEGYVVVKCVVSEDDVATAKSLRTTEMIQKFRAQPQPQGQVAPLLTYFSTLLEKSGKLNAEESVELCELVVLQKSGAWRESWFRCTFLSEICYAL